MAALKGNSTAGNAEMTSFEDFGFGLLRPELSNYSPASNLSQNDAIRERQRAGEPIVNLGFGQSPFPIPQPAVDSLRQHAADGRYLPACGIPQLRQAVSNFHRQLDQLDVDVYTADGVVCGPGSKELIFLIMTVFRGTVYIGAPSWTTYRPQTLLTGRPCVALNLSADSGWKITPEIIGANLTGDSHRLLVLTNPDNPTGQVYSDSELAALAEFFRRERFIVISDEIYARLNFAPAGHQSLARHYPEGTIVTSGLSKWAGAGGWRLGYALFPRQLDSIRRAVASAATHTYSCCAAPVQHAALTLLGNPDEAEAHSRKSARILAALARHCDRQLTGAGAIVASCGGGFYLLPDFEVARAGIERLLGSDAELTGAAMCARILADTGVALMPAGPAFLRPERELTVRLCFVEFDGAAALRAVQQLEEEEEKSKAFGQAARCAPLPEDFTARFCEPTHSAVVRLADWLRSVQQC